MQVLTDSYADGKGFAVAEVDELFLVGGGSSNPLGQAAGTAAVVGGLITIAEGAITRNPATIVKGVAATIGGCITVVASSKP